MSKVRLLALLIVGLLTIGVVASQEKKDIPTKDKPKEPLLKGMLPKHFDKLKLSEDQEQAIFKVQKQHGPTIADLEAKLKAARAAQAKDFDAVLTDEQKKKLI